MLSVHRTPLLSLVILPLLLAGCPEDAPAVGTSDAAVSADGDAAPTPVVWCEGATKQVYDPLVGARLELWPDDFFSRDDADSPTGLRLQVNNDNAPWTADVEELLRGAILDLNVLTGFGRNAGGVITFDAAVGALPAATPEAWQESVTTDAIQLLDLSTDPPERIPYEISTNDEDKELIIWPLRPLRPSTLHAFVVTTSFKAADGDCIAPSDTLRDLLTGQATDPALTRLHDKYATLLAKTGLNAGDISAATVFTTHGDLEVIKAAADEIRARTYGWATAPVCTEQANFRRCEGTFESYDYRGPDGYIADAAPTGGTWELQATVWLPKDGVGSAPYPTVMFGHGLSTSRNSGGELANAIAPLGFAVFALDALEHGDHPTAGASGDLAALEFLGINLDAVTIEALVLRGNFNQSMLDRHQFVELLHDVPDVDGDGSPDIALDGMGYHGISLGGMMGPPLLAMSDRFEAALLAVAGGRLLTFATDNSQVEPFKPILYNLLGGEAEYVRLLTVAQALVDAADSATYAAHVLDDRLIGAAPDLLMHVAIEDDTVPPSSGKALARALGLPHVGTVFDPVRLLPTDSALPASANLAVSGGGSVTAGFFQLNRVTSGDGATPATHGNVAFGPEGRLQLLHFLETWWDTGRAEILDAYVELSTPPLP